MLSGKGSGKPESAWNMMKREDDQKIHLKLTVINCHPNSCTGKADCTESAHCIDPSQ